MKLSAFLVLLFLLLSAQAATYKLHTVHSGSVASRVRIVNLSDVHGVVDITGFDDRGEEYGPVELDMEAHASTILLTREIENGAPDKGLLYGLGDGSGQWQLHLTTNLQISAVSFKSGVLSDILSSTEQAGEGLPEHFMWVHKLADKGASTLSVGPGASHLRGRESGTHELLSAYSWEPLGEVHGMVIGKGNYEHPKTTEAWSRLGGRLEYSFFAVHYGLLYGQPEAHAYAIGRGSDCFALPSGTEYAGAAVYVSAEGEFGYGEITIEPNSTYAAENDITALSSSDFQMAIHVLRESGLRPPYGSLPGLYPGGWVFVGDSEATWNAYRWNPPEFMNYASKDPDASPKPTWDELVQASVALGAGLSITAAAYDVETRESLLAEIGKGTLFDEFSLRAYGPSQHCLEFSGSATVNGSDYWAFGARRVESDDPNL